MAKLTDAHKRFIVQALARWDTPSQIADALKDEFDPDVHRSQVAQYDPTKAAGRAMSKRRVQLFNDTRQRFRQEVPRFQSPAKRSGCGRLARSTTGISAGETSSALPRPLSKPPKRPAASSRTDRPPCKCP